MSAGTDKILKPRPHPPALAHGELEQVLENIWFVTGTIDMFSGKPCLQMKFSRNMVVLRQNKDELILVNSLRLDEHGLQALDALGTVQHVIRLGAFHGSDDAFYKERYPSATVWAIEGMTYFPGFDTKSQTIYFQADKIMNSTTKDFPVVKSSLIVIESKPPKDGILVLERPEGKVFITGDSLQNFETCDEYFNCLARISMKPMGFICPCNVGPAWAKVVNVQQEEMHKLLTHKFDHVLPTHGRPVLGQAWKRYEPAITRMKTKK